MRTFKTDNSKYAEHIKESGIKPSPDTDIILEILLKTNGYVDTIELHKKINQLNYSINRAKISSVLKRLNDKGILDKRRIDIHNHFVYKLRSLRMIQEGKKYVNSRSMNLGFW